MLYAKAFEIPVLKGEGLGVLDPVIRKNVSCWDSVLRIADSGATRFGSEDAMDARMVMMTPIAAPVITFALDMKSCVSLTG